MKIKLNFHIGLEKTGTDSFQRFCKEHDELLMEYSVLYPIKSLAFAKYNHEPLVSCYLSGQDFSIRSSGESRLVVLQSLMTEIDRNAADVVLLSAEHFSSRFGDAEISQLAVDFSNYDCRIAVVVRDHHSRVVSAYSQTVLGGRDMTLDEYCDEIFHPDNRYMRYAETISAWERVFGRENISVFCYEPGKSIIPVLCENLISPTMSVASIESYWDNKSLGPGPTERLYRANKAIARVPVCTSSFARWIVLRYARRGMAKVLAMRDKYRSDVHWHLSTHNLERLREIAEFDDVWLQDHYDVRLAGDTTLTVRQ